MKIQIGKVRRIDVVDRDDLLHFNEENPIQAAFIHMDYWYNTYNAITLRNVLNTQGEMRQRGFHNGIEMVKFTGNQSQFDHPFRYFVFKINHKPIPDADGKLNIHQLAALKTKHEAQLEEAYFEIERLKEVIENIQTNPRTSTPVSPPCDEKVQEVFENHCGGEKMSISENALYQAFSKSSFE
jgi:hypothetical protein